MTELTDIVEAKILKSSEKIQVLNKTIKDLKQSVGQVNKIIDAAESNWHVMVAKLSEEKCKTNSAIANSRVLIAKIEKHIEEVEHQLENEKKKVKLNNSADMGLQSTPVKRRLVDKAQQTSPPKLRNRTRAPRRKLGRSKSMKSFNSSRSSSQSAQNNSSTDLSNSKTPVKRSLISNNSINKVQNPVLSTRKPTPVRRNFKSNGASYKVQNSVSSSAFSSLESSRSISESIVAEFDKPFVGLPDKNNSESAKLPKKPQKPRNGLTPKAGPSKSQPTNPVQPKAVTSQNSKSQNIEPPKTKPPRVATSKARPPRRGPTITGPPKIEPPKAVPPKIAPRKRKIYPVQNVAAFKKPHELLSLKSHIIYAPPSEITAQLKPLNADDPRTYYVEQTLEPKTGPIKLIISRKLSMQAKLTMSEKKNETRHNIRPPSDDKLVNQITPEQDEAIFNNKNTIFLPAPVNNLNSTKTPQSPVNESKILVNSLSSQAINVSSRSQDVPKIIDMSNQSDIESTSGPQNKMTSPPSLPTEYSRISTLTAEDSDSSTFSEEFKYSSPDIFESEVNYETTSTENKTPQISESNFQLFDLNSRSLTQLLEPTSDYLNGAPEDHDNKHTAIENRTFASIFVKSESVTSPKSSTPISPDHHQNDVSRLLKQESFSKPSTFMLEQKNIASEIRPANSDSQTLISQSTAAEFENPFQLPDLSRAPTPIIDMLPVTNIRTPSPVSKQSSISNECNNHTTFSTENAKISTPTSPKPGYTKKSPTLNMSIDSDASILSLNFRYADSPTFTEIGDDDMELENMSTGSIITSSITEESNTKEVGREKDDETKPARPISKESIHNQPISRKFESILSPSTSTSFNSCTTTTNKEQTTLASIKSEKSQTMLRPATENSSTGPPKSGRLSSTSKVENRSQNSLKSPERQDTNENRRKSSLSTEEMIPFSPMSPDHPDNTASRSFKSEIKTMSTQNQNRPILSLTRLPITPISPEQTDNIASRSIKSEKSMSINNEITPTRAIESRKQLSSMLEKPNNTKSIPLIAEKIASNIQGENRRILSNVTHSKKLLTPMSPDHPDNTVSQSFKSEMIEYISSLEEKIRITCLVSETTRPVSPMSPNYSYENTQESLKTENMYPQTPLKYLENNKSTPMSPQHPENNVARSYMQQVGNYTPSTSRREENALSKSRRQEKRFMREEIGNNRPENGYMRRENTQSKSRKEEKGYIREEIGNNRPENGYMRQENTRSKSVKQENGYRRQETTPSKPIKQENGYMGQDNTPSEQIKQEKRYIREDNGNNRAENGYMRRENTPSQSKKEENGYMRQENGYKRQENRYSSSVSSRNRRVFSPARNRQNFRSPVRDRYSYSSRDKSRHSPSYSRHREYKNTYNPSPQRETELRHLHVPSSLTYRRRDKPYSRDSERYHSSTRRHYQRL